MKKRVLALAVAGATALVLGGAFGLSAHTGHVEAAGASTVVVGCAQGTGTTSIAFPTNAAGVISGTQIAGPATSPNNSINLLSPATTLECAALLQDVPGAAVGPPAGSTTTTGGVDTVTGGTTTITGATISAAAGGAGTLAVGDTGCTITDSGGATTVNGGTTATTTTTATATTPGNTTVTNIPAGTIAAPATNTSGGILSATCPNGHSGTGLTNIQASTVTNVTSTGSTFTNVGGVVVTPVTPPAGFQDGNPNTVDSGTVTYTLANAGGRFTILNNLSNTYTVQCGSDNVPAGFEGCQGAVAGTGVVTPNTGLIINLGFAPGVPLNAFGSLSGLQGVNFGFALTATYTRFADLSATPGAIGPSTGSATIDLALLAPTYYLGLAANPTTISAASGGSGSVITASLYTVTTNPLVIGLGATGNIVIGGSGIVTASGAVLTPGAEPGTVTFVTNNGIFGTPSSTAASSQQTVAVACGVVPGSNLIFNAQTFSFGTFSFSSCVTATATLYGGGAAGSATVVATYVGSITGQTTQNAVSVGFSPTGNTTALTRGCDEVITPSTLAANTAIATYVGTVTPSGVVVSVWQYNNATQSFNALYFSTPGAPTNGSTVGPNQSVFICVSGAATVPNGAF